MPLPFLLLMDEAVDTELFPAPIVLELQIPGTQLDVALSPAPLLLALRLPTPSLLSGNTLSPAPIVLGLSIPPSTFVFPPRLIHMTSVSFRYGNLDRVRFRH